MKINEIIVSEAQINELDVLGGIASLGKDAAKAAWGAMSNPTRDQFKSTVDFAKSYTSKANPDDSTDYSSEMPNDGERAYYKDTSYTYDANSKTWYETETEKKAGLVAQRALMLQYGFTASGKPTIALRKKILRKKRRTAQGISADKKFKPAAVAKIVNAFQQSMNEYHSTGDLIRYLNNAEFLSQYIAQGYDLTLLKKPMANFFDTSVSSDPSHKTILSNLYQNLFVKPDAAKVADIKNTYRGSGTRPASATSRPLPAAEDTKIKTGIVKTISMFNKDEAAQLPTHLNTIKSAGYDITPLQTLIQSETNKIVNRSHKYKDLGDMNDFLDTMIALKPTLPGIPATYGAKINSLNFMAMFPSIGVRELEALRQKRAAIITP